MISPLLPNYGLRIVRDIALESSGSRVTFINRLEKSAPAASNCP